MNAASKGRAAGAVGGLAVVASAVYWVSDLWEALAGGFTGGQLWLTLVAEASVPVFVIGLDRACRGRWGRWGTIAAVGYAVAYLYFTGTVVYALREHSDDFSALSRSLDPWMTVAGVVMVVSGVGLGLAIVRTRAYPPWTGWFLGVGVGVVAATVASPDALQLAATGIRDAAWAGMGWALLAAGAASSSGTESGEPGRAPAARPARSAGKVSR